MLSKHDVLGIFIPYFTRKIWNKTTQKFVFFLYNIGFRAPVGVPGAAATGGVTGCENSALLRQVTYIDSWCNE